MKSSAALSEAGGKWQISIDGGAQPMWALNGRELFYKSGDFPATPVPAAEGVRPAIDGLVRISTEPLCAASWGSRLASVRRQFRWRDRT